MNELLTVLEWVGMGLGGLVIVALVVAMTAVANIS
jgi:hypothetical protein